MIYILKIVFIPYLIYKIMKIIDYEKKLIDYEKKLQDYKLNHFRMESFSQGYGKEIVVY